MSQQGINFFGWIREGVKQSVLLGVNDAIETLGTPADPSSMHPHVVALMQGKKVASLPNSTSSVSKSESKSYHGKRRLGRSLRDIEPVTNGNSTTKS